MEIIGQRTVFKPITPVQRVEKVPIQELPVYNKPPGAVYIGTPPGGTQYLVGPGSSSNATLQNIASALQQLIHLVMK